MNKPDEALESQFNKSGVFFLPQDELPVPGTYIGAKIEIAVPEIGASTLGLPDFNILSVSKRGVAMRFCNWRFVLRNEIRHLQFETLLQTPVEDPWSLGKLPLTGMTFMDLCFYTGNEAIPENYAQDVATVFRGDAVKADLGWILPSRFVDHLVESLGKMNALMFSGLLQDAIIYGPIQTRHS